MMKIEMPEIAAQEIEKMTSTISDPLKDIYSVLKAPVMTDGYRNRCAAKAAVEQICRQLDSGKQSITLNMILGRGHLEGVRYLLESSMPDLTVKVVDHWAKYIDMGVEDRIVEANRIRALLK